MSHPVTLLLATNLRQTGKSASRTVKCRVSHQGGAGIGLRDDKTWVEQLTEAKIPGQQDQRPKSSTSSWLGTGRNATAPVALYWIMIASQIIFWKAQGDSPTVK